MTPPVALESSAGETRTIRASAAATATADTGVLPGYGAVKTLRVQLNVTAVSGTTPNLVLTVEDTLDGGATWNVVDTFTAVTAAGRQVRNITTPFADNLRYRWTITGTTPSFTFSVVEFANN